MHTTCEERYKLKLACAAGTKARKQLLRFQRGQRGCIKKPPPFFIRAPLAIPTNLYSTGNLSGRAQLQV